MLYLNEDEIIKINQRVLDAAGKGLSGLLDPRGLNSVVEAPQQVFFGREAYPTIWLKAAYYLQKITKKHVFADGNKRTALESTKLFLLLNGVRVDLSDAAAGQMVLDVTNAPDSEQVMVEVANYLKRR